MSLSVSDLSLSVSAGLAPSLSSDAFRQGVGPDLKRFQREVLEARAVILSEIDRLVATGMSCSRAIARFVRDARQGLLPISVHHMMLRANARSGIKAASRKAAFNDMGTIQRTISRSTLYLWLKERSEKGIAALAPKKVDRGPYMPPWAPAMMQLYGRPQKPSLLAVIEQLPALLKPGVPMPSYGQASRFLNKLSTQARAYGRMGTQEIKTLKAYVHRDVSNLWAGAVYAADGHRFDAEVAHPRHGRPFRPEITTVIDVYSRKVVGWSVALHEDTITVMDAARHAFESHGVPAIWYTDNGKGFNNQTFDDALTGFLARTGVTKKNSLPYNSQARGVIERLHQSLWVRSAKSLDSFVGKHMDREARRASYKITLQDIKRYGRTNRLMQWDDFMVWAREQVEAYNSRPHRGLPRLRDKATFKRRPMTPGEAWQAGVKEHGAPDKPDLSIEAALYRPCVKRRTNRGLVSFHGNRYFARELEAWHGEEVIVAYDIHDAGKVWVYDRDDQLIALARFEGNKQSYFPVEVVRRAEENRLRRARKNLEVKQDILALEQETLNHETLDREALDYEVLDHEREDRVPATETGGHKKEKGAPGRPRFASRADWIK